MAKYLPLHITNNETGLVQGRQEFLIPNDAYPNLRNAFVFRERIQRKKGLQLLGRLRRLLNNVLLSPNFAPPAPGTYNYNLLTGAGLSTIEPYASIIPGNVSTITCVFVAIGQSLVDNLGTGTMTVVGVGPITSATINYATSTITVTVSGAFNSAIRLTCRYNPNLPVMGLCTKQESSNITNTIVFDQRYAYLFNAGVNQYDEYIPGTTWNANNSTVSAVDFFSSTNWWTSSLLIPGTATPFFTTENRKIFWVTNNTGQNLANADPIRITDGVSWVNFSPPNFGQIDITNYLLQALVMIPFRGRLLMFNTWEGTAYGTAINNPLRIRYSSIGNPFIPYSGASQGSWRDDVRGQGGYIDIPTSGNIASASLLQDSIVIQCDNNSTYQLRYTGQAALPFQIELVNSELGGNSAFSTVQFDTFVISLGNRGIIECDNYKASKIDIKIPDYVFNLQTDNNAFQRIFGVRDFKNRIAYWNVCASSQYSSIINSTKRIFPNERLVYNYENKSWALFNDSITCLGYYQVKSVRNWVNTTIPWVQCNFAWISQPLGVESVIAGNQHGFVFLLDQLTTNDSSLFIQNIQGLSPSATRITCPNHNLVSSNVISVDGVLGQFSNLNGLVFGIVVIDENTFDLFLYDSSLNAFATPQIDSVSKIYLGGGVVKVRDNFSIKSKKFNFLEEGKSIQLGFIDVLTNSTPTNQPGEISLNVYVDYNDFSASNTLPQNEINDYSVVSNPDTFFNSVIPTTQSSLNGMGGTKFWQRVFCSTRGNFITIEYTLNNSQMAGIAQTKELQIDAQVLWFRQAGRMTQI